jgi:predicted PurR-regulated permease PerM
MGEERPRDGVSVKKVTAAVAAALGLVLCLLVAYKLSNLLLLLFAGLLAGIFLRHLANLLSARTGLGRGVSLGVVVFGLMLLVGGIGWFVAPDVSREAGDLAEAIPSAISDLRDDINAYEWGRQLNETLNDSDPLIPAEPTELLAQARRILSLAMGGLAGLLVVFVIGIYLAASPDAYRNGLLRLVPVPRRKRAREVIDACVDTLRRWLFGRLLVMLIVGSLTGLGLWALGLPLVLVLALLATVLEFIPNIGPILAMIPAVLIAWMMSPMTAAYVLVLYFAIQQLESFFLTPLVVKKTVHLPPVLTIVSILAFAVLFGPMGVLLASPITAVLYVLVKMLYVEDVLGDREATVAYDG